MRKLGAVLDREPLVIDDAVADELGQLELVELGRAGQELFRGRHAKLGVSWPSYLGVFVGALGQSIPSLTGLLTDALGFPVNLVSSGVDEVLGGLAGLVGQIPIIGSLGAIALLAANVLVQAAATLTLETLKFVGNLGAAFKTLSPALQQQFTQLAMTALIQAAPDDQKAAVQQTLEQAPPPGALVVEGTGGGFPYGEVAVTVLNGLAIGALVIL
jgi:hypothetical protein